jgi:hypothetical protein
MMRSLVALSIALAGCAADASSRTPPLDPAAFVEARTRIEAWQRASAGERTEKIALRVDAPYMPAAMTARGAVAVRPPEALRMILLGPGGTTAMDLWSKGDRYRFAIPALDRTMRGDASTSAEQKRGLPVDFLRWWMLRPLGGRLLAARRDGATLEVLLADGDRVTEARLEPSGKLSAHRRWWTERDGLVDEEWLEAAGPGCSRVTYRQRSTSIEVEATCESRRDGASEAAFEEPKEASP